MLIIGIPICLFQLLFNPDKFIQTLFSTIGFALGLAIILGIVHILKNYLKMSNTPNPSIKPDVADIPMI